jgi:hypothetical protein
VRHRRLGIVLAGIDYTARQVERHRAPLLPFLHHHDGTNKERPVAEPPTSRTGGTNHHPRDAKDDTWLHLSPSSPRPARRSSAASCAPPVRFSSLPPGPARISSTSQRPCTTGWQSTTTWFEHSVPIFKLHFFSYINPWSKREHYPFQNIYNGYLG